MKFIPIDNQPNISSTRYKSVSPSMRIDSIGYPHIAWTTKKQGYNEIRYKYWDGFDWKSIDHPNITQSNDSVSYSQNILSLDQYDSPIISYSIKSLNDIEKIGLATTSGGIWEFNNIDVNYSILWHGIHIYSGDILDSSSLSSESMLNLSSSSSSMNSLSSSSSSSLLSSESIEPGIEKYYIVTYGSDSVLRIYSYHNSWELVGSISVTIGDLSSLKTILCGRKIAIAYVDQKTNVKYNFFDLNSYSFNWSNFKTLSSSITVNNIIGMSIDGFHISGYDSLRFSWITVSNSISILYYCSTDIFGTESLSELETSISNVVMSSGFIFGGYRETGISHLLSGYPIIFAGGANNSIYSYDGASWTKSAIDISCGCEFSPSSICAIFDSSDNKLKLSLSNSSNDIYYFEQDSANGFDIVYPETTIMNAKRLYIAPWQNGALNNGKDIFGIWNSKAGGMLRDGVNPVGIFDTDEEICSYSSSSSSSSLSSSSSSFEFSSLSSLSSLSDTSEEKSSSSSSSQSESSFPVDLCDLYLESAGGNAGYYKEFDVSKFTLISGITLNIEYFITYVVKDRLQVKADFTSKFDSGCIATSDSGISGQAIIPQGTKVVSVQVFPRCDGVYLIDTRWKLKITCDIP